MKRGNADQEKKIGNVLGTHLTGSFKCDLSHFSLSRDMIGK